MSIVESSTSSRAKLSYTQIGLEQGRRVWVLHGIMGSRQNWSRFARHLSQAQPDLQITTIDLRCHGDTEKVAEPHHIEACVEDLLLLAQNLSAPQVLIGHSFGGKVALAYAAQVSKFNQRLGLEKVWTLDSPLAADIRPGQGEVSRVIEACGQMSVPQPSRQEVVDYFKDQGFSLGIAQWMTTNLRRSKADEFDTEGFTWKFDLSGIKALIANYWQIDGWQLLQEMNTEIEVHLLRAEHGLRWTTEDEQRLQKEHPSVKAPLLKNSGHWVHIEQLDALVSLLAKL